MSLPPYDAQIDIVTRPYRASNTLTAANPSSGWLRVWSARKFDFFDLVAILYGPIGEATGYYEFTFDTDENIKSNDGPVFERWPLGEVMVDHTLIENDPPEPPCVANMRLPSPTGFRVTHTGGADLLYVVEGR